MPRGILIDEFQLTVTTSQRLSPDRRDAMYRTLQSGRFRTLLRDAVRKVVKRFASLRSARFSLSR
jgi:hypothetical protein